MSNLFKKNGVPKWGYMSKLFEISESEFEKIRLEFSRGQGCNNTSSWTREDILKWLNTGQQYPCSDPGSEGLSDTDSCGQKDQELFQEDLLSEEEEEEEELLEEGGSSLGREDSTQDSEGSNEWWEEAGAFRERGEPGDGASGQHSWTLLALGETRPRVGLLCTMC